MLVIRFQEDIKVNEIRCVNNQAGLHRFYSPEIEAFYKAKADSSSYNLSTELEFEIK